MRRLIVQQVEKSTLELNGETLSKQEEANGIGIIRKEILSNNKLLYAQWFEHGIDSPSVFIVHGNGESLSDWVDTQKILHELGYNSFVFDFSGFGSSEGKATVNTLNKSTQDAWLVFCEISKQSKQHIIVAHSLGVAVLLDALKGFNYKPNKIILHGAFSSAREIAIAFGNLKRKWAWLVPNVWNNKKAIRNTKSIETILFHSIDDQKIPFAMSESIAKIGANVKFNLLNDYGHNAVYENPKIEFWEHLLN